MCVHGYPRIHKFDAMKCVYEVFKLNLHLQTIKLDNNPP